MWALGAPSPGAASTQAPPPTYRAPSPRTYRERQVFLGLLLGWGLLGLGGHHGHRRRLGSRSGGWGRGGRQGRGGRGGRGRRGAGPAVVKGRPLLELRRERRARRAGLLGGAAGLQAGVP